MQHPVTPALETLRAETAEPKRGPVELDPSLLELVSGGSPKNGWGVVTLSVSTTDSPKNGWL